MAKRSDKALWLGLFRIGTDAGQTLQAQIRQTIVTAILDRQIPVSQPLPSSRTLARRLNVARGTVVLAYQQLADQGFLIPHERKGHFVNPDALTLLPEVSPHQAARAAQRPDWQKRARIHPTGQRNIEKPADWLNLPYPFVYGQFDPSLFPTAEWRECVRMALGVREIRSWASDMIDRDDPLLIEQIQARLLPRRGVFVKPQDIIVTLGAQHALFLLATLLFSAETTVGLEEPGYPDARNAFAMHTTRQIPLAVDEGGLMPEAIPSYCDYIFTTPSHQCPTTVPLQMERRRALLEHARRHDAVIIEDDYDSQLLDQEDPLPALKGLDDGGRVIYVGSLSKTLAPGLRLGYLVADAALVRELRALRRLMLRHPPANNQRAVALFLSLGHHDALIRRMTKAFAERRATLCRALAEWLPEAEIAAGSSGTAVWLKGPARFDSTALAERVLAQGVLIEPGEIFFSGLLKQRNTMRLCVSSIREDRIEEGVKRLARAAVDLRLIRTPEAA